MTDILRILIAPLVWLASFSAVYGLHGMACAFGWAETGVWGIPLLRLVLTAAWLGAIAAQGLILTGLYSQRFASPSGFVRGVSKMTGWTGLVAALWSLFPVVMTSSCQ
jgi:hypothetical protein